jgi:hypothetical protein
LSIQQSFIYWIVLLVAACGGEDECERAAGKLESCGIRDAGTPRECQNDTDECISRCVNQATCDDIMNPTAEGEYVSCLKSCSEDPLAQTPPSASTAES